MELSGATTANWVAKTANLLVDSLGGPGRIGLLLPLHWQPVCLLLAGVATGATVVVARTPDDLAGCQAVFTTVEHAEAALDAGADDVLALSGHPLGARLPAVPALVSDYAVEVPGHGDHWGGGRTPGSVELDGAPLPVPAADLGPADRLLCDVPLTDVGWVLAALRAGAAVVLAPDASGLDLPSLCASERVTATVGVDVVGLPRLDVVASP